MTTINFSALVRPALGALALTAFAALPAGAQDAAEGAVEAVAGEATQHTQFILNSLIMLIGGILVLLAGFAVMRGALWARIVGITLASLSALANFFFIPFYPFWSLTVITLDILVIWALAAHGKALVEG